MQPSFARFSAALDPVARSRPNCWQRSSCCLSGGAGRVRVRLCGAPMARPWLARVLRRAAVAAEGAPGGQGARRSSSSGAASAASPAAAASGGSLQQVPPAALGPLAQQLDRQQQVLHGALGRPVSVARGTLFAGGMFFLGVGVALGVQKDRFAPAAGSAGPRAAPAASSGDWGGAGAWGAVVQRSQQLFADYLPTFKAHSQAQGAAAAAVGSNAAAAAADQRASSAAPLGGCLSPFFISDAAAKAAPAVVNITVQAHGSVGSSGSGFIVDPDGTILTNAHVVSDAVQRHYFGSGPPAHGPSPLHGGGQHGSGGGFGGGGLGGGRAEHGQQQHGADGRAITVTLQDGRIFEGRLVSYDYVSDLAVLKVESDSPLPAAKLGASNRLRVGEWVVALGSPLHLQNSVTAGIVSCVDRKAVELGLAGARTDYIQTDAAINKGNSGGPLVNLYGEVVGISAMKALAADGVSFAIPVDTAVDVMRQLREHGRVIRPYVGIKMLQLSKHHAEEFRKRDPNFPRVDSGILVPGVHPNSPAERAGLRPGDVIVGFGRHAGDATTTALIKALGDNIGQPLDLKVARPGGVERTLTVVALEASDGHH